MTQVQIFIDKDDLLGSKYVYDVILKHLIEHNVAGATVFEGWMGFGKNHILKKPHDLLSFDHPPLMISFVDEDEKVEEALSSLREIYKGGLIVKSKVEVV
ncbi:DUF190 domain-containing protein [Flectobacillus longus]|uniref:DUF190 domain-containing protein n=1 Tax=Flectobacillus longus TaxID=2984207 RepID=UPI0024B7C9F3|nr:DUF190 domain-containing protein [Flectobacillus longus]MDI9881582.1 DUF190 domain-containing protein [Flectobacillus longus]